MSHDKILNTIRRLRDTASRHDASEYRTECIRYIRTAVRIFRENSASINKYSQGTDVTQKSDEIVITMSSSYNNIIRQASFVPNQLALFKTTEKNITTEENVKTLFTLWVILVMHIEDIGNNPYFKEITKTCSNIVMHNKHSISISIAVFILACNNALEDKFSLGVSDIIETDTLSAEQHEFIKMIYTISLCNICYFYKTISVINKGTCAGLASVFNFIKSF